MRELTKIDVQKNRVDTINQFKILNYLKKNLNIDEFKVYLIDRDNIKVVDRNNKYLYFSYDKYTREITNSDELLETKDLEIGR